MDAFSEDFSDGPRAHQDDAELQELVQSSVRDAVEAASKLSIHSSEAEAPSASSAAEGTHAGSSAPDNALHKHGSLRKAATGAKAPSRATSRRQTADLSKSRPQSAAGESRRASRSIADPQDGGPSCADALDVPDQPQATLRLHKAQIRALENDVAAANAALHEESKRNKELSEEAKALRAERAAAAKAHKTLDSQVIKLQKQVEELVTQLGARDAALRQVSDERNMKERAKRATEGDLKAHNARLNRALEEVQRYRRLLEETKEAQKNEKTVAQSEHNRVVTENRKLERQKAELLAAFRKQMKLIDVLKRQKVHIEAARMLQFSEDEFMRALEMPATTF